MSFVFGFACAQGGRVIKNYKAPTKDTTITSPMHQSSSIPAVTYDCTIPEETYVTFVTNYASQGRIDRDIVVCTTKPSAPLEDNKGGPPSYLNSS